MSHNQLSAKDALQRLKKISGINKKPRLTDTTQIDLSPYRKSNFDSDPTNSSLASGQIDQSKSWTDDKIENVTLKLEKQVTSQINDNMKEVRTTIQFWGTIILAAICGISIILWINYQDKISSMSERIVKLETVITLHPDKSQQQNKTKKLSN